MFDPTQNKTPDIAELFDTGSTHEEVTHIVEGQVIAGYNGDKMTFLSAKTYHAEQYNAVLFAEKSDEEGEGSDYAVVSMDAGRIAVIRMASGAEVLVAGEKDEATKGRWIDTYKFSNNDTGMPRQLESHSRALLEENGIGRRAIHPGEYVKVIDGNQPPFQSPDVQDMLESHGRFTKEQKDEMSIVWACLSDEQVHVLEPYHAA